MIFDFSDLVGFVTRDHRRKWVDLQLVRILKKTKRNPKLLRKEMANIRFTINMIPERYIGRYFIVLTLEDLSNRIRDSI